MACITESGRVLDISPMRKGKDVLELIDGVWTEPSRPVSGDEIWNARVLSKEELAAYMEKSGKLSRRHILRDLIGHLFGKELSLWLA